MPLRKTGRWVGGGRRGRCSDPNAARRRERVQQLGEETAAADAAQAAAEARATRPQVFQGVAAEGNPETYFLEVGEVHSWTSRSAYST